MLTWREPPSCPVDRAGKPVFGLKAVDCAAPGDVSATLLRQGKIPDPRKDEQVRGCYRLGGKEWWCCLNFNSDNPGLRKADLCLTGVDGPADIRLSNNYPGEAQNCFRRFRFKAIDELPGGPLLDNPVGMERKESFSAQASVLFWPGLARAYPLKERFFYSLVSSGL